MKLGQQQRHGMGGSSDEEAILLFNHIKETYAQKIDELTELKRVVFSTDQIDQQQRSKLRITIESLLIDLNEEIFSISEELAKSFTFERQKNLYQKASEFEQRKNALLKKIKETIDQNQSVKILRRQQKIQQLSPPSRDLNTFGMQTQEAERITTYKHQNQTSGHKKQMSSPGIQLKRNFSSSKNEGFNTQTDNIQREEPITTEVFQKVTNNASQRSSIPRKKSPIPLRRKENTTTTLGTEGTHRQHSNSSRKPSSNSSKKQLFAKDPYKESKKDQQLKKNIKKLEDFEKYLNRKQGNVSVLQQSANKENKRPNEDQVSTIQLQSEAFENFAQEFAHMKSKFQQMQQRLMDQEEKTKELETQVDKLNTENLKLTTDVKIIRNEHSEILHSLFTLEKKNSQLNQENQTLKRILTGERELKGQETNLPKPYQENQNETQVVNDRKQSPFSSFLQKNRSFSHLRESKDSNISLIGKANDVANNTQKNFNFKADNNDFVSFQPSLQQTYKNQNQQELNQYHNLRSSQKNWPGGISHHNPLLSVSNERNALAAGGTISNSNNSFIQLQNQQQLTQLPSRILSIPQSRRGGGIQDTPTTPDHVMVMTDETPNHQQNRIDDYLSRGQRTFNNGSKRLTPTSSSQHMMLGATTNDANLSDWVLERLNKKHQ